MPWNVPFADPIRDGRRRDFGGATKPSDSRDLPLVPPPLLPEFSNGLLCRVIASWPAGRPNRAPHGSTPDNYPFPGGGSAPLRELLSGGEFLQSLLQPLLLGLPFDQLRPYVLL